MGRIAIITGGSRGIGAATATLAADRGYDVCIAYASDTEAAEGVAEACRAKGARALAVTADVASSAEVAALFAACDAELGPVTLLVNNAGIVGQVTPVAGLTEEALRRTVEVNLYGTVFCAQEAIRRMARSAGGDGGAIVNISSIAATLGSPGEYVHYAASKAGVEAFTVGLSKEVGPDGIRVNVIQVGTTDTGIHARSGNPERPAMVAETAPLRRVGTPEDIAEAILFLGSEQSAYTTGAVLRVGGGI